MRKSILITLVAIILQVVGITVHADMVILKSGEMFQTRKAWQKDGSVYFYRNGQVVRYRESDVERLIESTSPQENKTAEPDQPLPAPQPPEPRASMGGDTGYLGLKWEQPPSPIEGLTPAGTDAAYGGVQLYIIKKHARRFGRASVDNIFLGFWQGGLYTIVVEVSNYLDFTDLKSEAFRRFGTGDKEGDDPERYRWSDPVSDRLLSYDDNTGTGYLWMRSHALHQKVRTRYPE
jgi:hypothetical protein